MEKGPYLSLSLLNSYLLSYHLYQKLPTIISPLPVASYYHIISTVASYYQKGPYLSLSFASAPAELGRLAAMCVCVCVCVYVFVCVFERESE